MSVYRGKTFYEEAIAYNKKNAIPIRYFTLKPVDSKGFAKDVSDFQKSNDDLTVDGKLGPNTLTYIRQHAFDTMGVIDLKRSHYLDVARLISRFEGNFWSLNRDGEFKGLFDRNGKRHWASGKIHIGLSYGFIQFTQDSGSLGKLLKKMEEVDSDLFKDVFGRYSDELVEVTNRPGKSRTNGRSPRVQKIGGHDLWDDYWASRFITAGKKPVFQEVQLDMALDIYMKPAIKTCKDLGIYSQRGLAVVFDRSVHFGPAGARRLLAKQGPVDQEHFYLREAQKAWRDHRWGHRTTKILQSEHLMDFCSNFT